MRELKKGDQMHQALQKVKQIVATMIKRVCLECAHSQELSDLQKIVRERVFETSNEADNTLENIEIVPTLNYSRGQPIPPSVIRTRGPQNPKTHAKANSG